jgi:hypothetical protein
MERTDARPASTGSVIWSIGPWPLKRPLPWTALWVWAALAVAGFTVLVAATTVGLVPLLLTLLLGLLWGVVATRLTKAVMRHVTTDTPVAYHVWAWRATAASPRPTEQTRTHRMSLAPLLTPDIGDDS